MLTEQKAKAYAKAKSAKKRNGAKHREARFAEADKTIALQNKYEALAQIVIHDTGFGRDEAEAYLDNLIIDHGGDPRQLRSLHSGGSRERYRLNLYLQQETHFSSTKKCVLSPQGATIPPVAPLFI
jgi:hypothetical protein